MSIENQKEIPAKADVNTELMFSFFPVRDELICAIFPFLKTHMTTSIAMRVCTVEQVLHIYRIKCSIRPKMQCRLCNFTSHY